METKEPVVLVVLVEAARLRWFMAALSLDGKLTPLLRSDEGDLATYQGLGFDDQVSFLRHRFCGVLQRGSDRLWPVGKKACQFAFLFAGVLPGTTEELIQRVAEHFVEWLLNPPVVVYTGKSQAGSSATPPFSRLAGTIDGPLENLLDTCLAPLFALTSDAGAWELSQRKGTWRPAEEHI